ncbi:MAG: GNAT family N-acetyltransferase [Rhodospirillales bacterium]
MTEQSVAIVDAKGPMDMDHIRSLFREYQEWLGVDLCFQGFEDELAGLPGKYSEPRGCLMLARDQGAKEGAGIAGGVGMWPLEEGICEMKRLYVRPPWRGGGLGRRLAVAIIGESAARGYRLMRLDTLAQLKEARALYESLGFKETGPYYDNPLDGVTYMELAVSE